LKGNYQHIGPGDARLILVQGAPRILPEFRPDLTAKVEKKLQRMGVEVISGVHVEKLDAHGVQIGDRYIETDNAFWLAGVKASPAGQWLGADVDRGGRVKVQADFSIPGHPEVFVVGDTACVVQKGEPLPGLAQPAIQGGQYAASVITAGVRRKPHPPPFKYTDKGSLAVVGRGYAVAEVGPFHTAGFFAFVLWVFVHTYFLIGFRSRAAVFMTYVLAYFTSFQRNGGAKIIMLGRKETLGAFPEARPYERKAG
jgi:NADH dehydrogenase